MQSTIQPSILHAESETPKFTIECVRCHSLYQTDELVCKNDNGLLRTSYTSRHLHMHDLPGIGKFLDWLPVTAQINTPASPVTYKSTGLARELGLTNLYIGFNGYWPEQGAHIQTCSFKELEAYPTLQLMQESGNNKIVLASAGNTGRAFAHAAVGTDIDVYIVVPESGMSKMWLPEEPTDNIHLISMADTCDYADAIQMAGKIANLPGMRSEGGVRNVARRDGMGTVMLDAAVTMGRMPDHYFQAIGSGTGGIAAWEASLRLRADGRYGETLPRLHLIQNLPFAPILNAWQHSRRDIVEEIDMPDPKKLIDRMYADVLSNRHPPYSMPGGVYDALTDTNGAMYGISTQEARQAKTLFERSEGIDIVAPAAVGVAGLVQAVQEDALNKDDFILLNITGGGVERLKEDFTLHHLQPEFKLDSQDIDIELIVR
ncbi:MAG: cysteate synthase [ANME-2 cluster archaeon]|jgi:cysteate synthase|nr:cysteate synthase [ANME-2 cluster archaeon]